MSRRGFTFVTVVAFMGTLAIGVAIVQTDASLMAMRNAARATARARARVAGASLAATLPPDAAGSVDLPGVRARAVAGSVQVEVSVRGKPLEVVIPR